uniref:Uncharacterized protein n=1 Tax=Desertifilum tharense IPPAS B-1220 TaxID=1781255 RepID=A0A1E5QJS2_9CYAN|nr:hypothetical protein BH720_12045 [Desertifilum tharense IPPAS B-1220]
MRESALAGAEEAIKTLVARREEAMRVESALFTELNLGSIKGVLHQICCTQSKTRNALLTTIQAFFRQIFIKD